MRTFPLQSTLRKQPPKDAAAKFFIAFAKENMQDDGLLYILIENLHANQMELQGCIFQYYKLVEGVGVRDHKVVQTSSKPGLR